MTTYIGLDFETTGLDPSQHLPFSLGLAWREPATQKIESFEFAFDFHSEGQWDSEALYVNRLEPNFSHSQSVDHMDWAICSFLMDQEWSPFDKKLVPVGWNVGGFDMRFMQTFFPQASKFFSHRYMELNTLAYAAEQANPCPYEGGWKNACKQKAVEQARLEGIDVNWHNAEWDAIASIFAFEDLHSALKYR